MSGLILLIEDDRRIRELLPRYFTQEGMTVLTAADGQSGLTLLAERQPDLVLLDVNLPDLNGWSILKRMRHGIAPEQPVIMLTGQSDVPDRLLGLDLGADDYIVKPFEPLEVVARVKAVLRRAGRTTTKRELLIFPGLRIDLAGRAVWREETPVNLTTKEFELLSALARSAGRVLTRQHLYDIGWGEEALGDDHTLDVTMNRLRQKLSQPDGHSYLTTIRGIGYKFEVHHGE
ncbi:MAG: response regulator transcription factor [Armatimonadota bacterium]